MSGTPGILVYAELLSNIRQISVGCSLPSPAAAGTTQAGISPDGASLTVRHAGEECTARLPARAVPIASLPVPAGGPLSLAWRLPLASPPSAARRVDEAQEAGPWTATGLAPGSGVTCRTCRAPIIPEGALAVWKDLPSENWAEMMEFWHCHKPHHDHGHADDQDHDHAHGHDRDGAKLGNEDLAARGYGANSRISAQPGTGFVDLTSFLFFEQDCTGLTTVSLFLSIGLRAFLFSGCASIIGVYIEGGQTSGNTRTSQWRGHRYSYPRLIHPYSSPRGGRLVVEPWSTQAGQGIDCQMLASRGSATAFHRDFLWTWNSWD